MPLNVQVAMVRAANDTNPTVARFLKITRAPDDTAPLEGGMAPDDFFRSLQTGQFDEVLDA